MGNGTNHRPFVGGGAAAAFEAARADHYNNNGNNNMKPMNNMGGGGNANMGNLGLSVNVSGTWFQSRSYRVCKLFTNITLFGHPLNSLTSTTKCEL